MIIAWTLQLNYGLVAAMVLADESNKWRRFGEVVLTLFIITARVLSVSVILTRVSTTNMFDEHVNNESKKTIYTILGVLGCRSKNFGNYKEKKEPALEVLQFLFGSCFV